jgi:type IX secretion system PorP/SprF family membrane protein
MKTNRYIILVCALFTFSFSKGQQEILYTQYIFSQLAVNPACAGNDNGLNVTALSRKQWFGFKGSPTSFSFIGQASLNDKKMENRVFFSNSNKRRIIPTDNNHVGLGVVLFNDRVGVSNTYISSFAYSYKIQFSPYKRLSLGLQASILSYSNSLNQLDNPNVNDPVFVNNVQEARFNFGSGIFYESDSYYIGVSVPQVLENYLNPNSQSDKSLRQYFLSGGYVFYLNRIYKFKPTVMVRKTEGLPAQFDLNANLLYRDKVWVGCSYRYKNSANVILEFLFSNNLKMGLAYDYPISEINKVAHGSAEIMINYNFMKSKKRVTNPRYF